jgi:hypothetical protein
MLVTTNTVGKYQGQRAVAGNLNVVTQLNRHPCSHTGIPSGSVAQARIKTDSEISIVQAAKPSQVIEGLAR